MKEFSVTVLPQNRRLTAEEGDNLLDLLREYGTAPDAPCGGYGTCGKCVVYVDGVRALACEVKVDRDMTVELPSEDRVILSEGGGHAHPAKAAGSFALAYDIGTTTVVCYLLDADSGTELDCEAMLNPQTPYGADVISRVERACKGDLDALTAAIRTGMSGLMDTLCHRRGISPQQIKTVSIVGNPCMQQLFLGISTDNLRTLPFEPLLTRGKSLRAADYLPECGEARLLSPPHISAFLGSDILGCMLSLCQDSVEEMTLVLDIGTNGEMTLGNKERMVACATAAGPALEGANICCGMRSAVGAIDRVWLEDSEIRIHTIENAPAKGICGSGLIDAVAALLRCGVINGRGRLQSAQTAPEYADRLREIDGQRVVYLAPNVYLTQQDIREVQLAKGAIAAGIEIMAKHLGLAVSDIERVLLAGAFGSHIDPESACTIGLLPPELFPKVQAVGNAAGMGAKLLAGHPEELAYIQRLRDNTEHLNLATVPSFQTTFARRMDFRQTEEDEL